MYRPDKTPKLVGGSNGSGIHPNHFDDTSPFFMIFFYVYDFESMRIDHQVTYQNETFQFGLQQKCLNKMSKVNSKWPIHQIDS